MLSGSATVSEAASNAESTMTPMRPILGSSQATGRTHSRYQGRRTGARSVNRIRPQAQMAPWASIHRPTARPLPWLASHVCATRTARVASMMNTPTNVAANTKRTTEDVVSAAPRPHSDPAASDSMTRKNRMGASHPTCCARWERPSVGSFDCRYGAANATTSPAITAPCATATPARRCHGRRHTEAMTNRARGTTAVALTKAPSVSRPEAVTSRSTPGSRGPVRPRAAAMAGPARTARAAATASPTNRSLWPLATVLKISTGFHATSATANGALSGHSRVVILATMSTRPIPASPATTLKAQMSATFPCRTRVIPAERRVNAGPYTAGVPRQAGPTSG